VLQNIRYAAKRALERLDEFKPLQLASPVKVEIDMSNPTMIDWWLWVPTIERNGPSSVRFHADDYRSAHRLFLVLQKLELA
jgi:D-aminopeptidase